jgi:hypothetical protein
MFGGPCIYVSLAHYHIATCMLLNTPKQHISTPQICSPDQVNAYRQSVRRDELLLSHGKFPRKAPRSNPLQPQDTSSPPHLPLDQITTLTQTREPTENTRLLFDPRRRELPHNAMTTANITRRTRVQGKNIRIRTRIHTRVCIEPRIDRVESALSSTGDADRYRHVDSGFDADGDSNFRSSIHNSDSCLFRLAEQSSLAVHLLYTARQSTQHDDRTQISPHRLGRERLFAPQHHTIAWQPIPYRTPPSTALFHPIRGNCTHRQPSLSHAPRTTHQYALIRPDGAPAQPPSHPPQRAGQSHPSPSHSLRGIPPRLASPRLVSYASHLASRILPECARQHAYTPTKGSPAQLS